MSTDTIANMITSIKNSNMRKSRIVEIDLTNTTRNIAEILLKEGFINQFRLRPPNEKTHKGALIITLRYEGRKKQPSITTIRQISKPGLRIYTRQKDIPKVLGGIGLVILSTSKGIMSDRNARQQGLGGEILCYVW